MQEIKKPKWKKAINIVIDVVLAIIVICCIGVSAYSLNSRSNSGVAWVGDSAPMVVLSNSMSGTIEKDDLIIINKVNLSENEKLEDIMIPNETIASFYYDVDGNRIIVTHMFIGTSTSSGGPLFHFRGTYLQNDSDILGVQVVTEGEIVGLYNGQRFAGVGGMISFMQSGVGFFVCFLIPMIIFFLYEAYKLIIVLLEAKKEKDLELAREKARLTEEERELERERIRQEILKEQEEANKKADD